MATTRSVAHTSHDWQKRVATKQALHRPPVRFTGQQAVAIGKGFATAAAEGDYSIYACCILPEHCHLIVGRHERDAGRIAGHLKAVATRELRKRNLWPVGEDSSWGRKYWAVFIDDAGWVENAIRYVESNPLKEGKRLQRWSFVTPFDHENATMKPPGLPGAKR